jgi:hypothetical protein
LIIHFITGFTLPFGWPAASLTTSMICFQGAVWGLASFPWIRVFVISAGAVGVIALNAMLAEAGMRHADREFVLISLQLGFLPVAMGAAWFGVKSERCGGWQSWGWVRSLWCSIHDALPRRTHPFTTPQRAQFWFEWRRRGLFMSFALAFTIAGGACLYFPFASIVDSGFPFACVVWMAVLPLWFLDLSGIALAKSDFWMPAVAMQPFPANRPMSDGDLLAGKLKVAISIVLLGCGIGLLLVLSLCTWERWQELWHVDRSARRLLSWMPSHSAGVAAVAALALVAYLFAALKCLTGALCLGLTGDKRTIMKHSYIGIGGFVTVVSGGAWFYQYPDYLDKVQVPLIIVIGVAFLWKLLATVRSFVAIRRGGLLPGSSLTQLSALWLFTAASLAGFAAVLWMHAPVPKPLLLLALAWLWPAAELFQCVIHLSANRHR